MSGVAFANNLDVQTTKVLDNRCAGLSTDTNSITYKAPGLLRYETDNDEWKYYDGTNYVDLIPAGVTPTLNELGDVTLTVVVSNDLLRYNGSVWENTKLAFDNDFTNVNFTSLTNGDLIKYNGSNFINFSPTYLDGAGISDNHLIKVVGGVTTETSFIETSVLNTSTSLQTYIPLGILGLLAGSIETEIFNVTKTRVHLTSTGISTGGGITVTSDGRVGIGIVAPEEELEVDGSIQIDSANVARLKFQQTGQNTHALGEIDAEQDGINGGDLQFYTKVDGASVTEKLRINNVGAIGLLGTNYGTSGQVLTSNGSGSAVSWADQIDTTYTQGTGVTINASNVISIGQSVNVSDSPSFTQLTLGYTGVNQGILNLQAFTNIGTDTVAQIKGILEGTNGGELLFYTKADSGGSLTERLRIANDGNVEFGTGTMNALQVNGTGRMNRVELSTNDNNMALFDNTYAGTSNYQFAKGLHINGIGNNANLNVGVRREGNASNSFAQVHCNRFLGLRSESHIAVEAGTFDIYFWLPAGKYLKINGVNWTQAPSDDRIKFNETLVTNGLDVINQVNVYKYDKVYELGHTPENNPYKKEVGVIAQEIQQIPELVHAVSVNEVTEQFKDKAPNGLPMSVCYDQIHSYHIKATQELHNLVKTLQTRIEVLEQR
jgi:hypothetical protein